jgi:hypothetical protein
MDAVSDSYTCFQGMANHFTTVTQSYVTSTVTSSEPVLSTKRRQKKSKIDDDDNEHQ